MQLRSPAFADGEGLPRPFTADGDNLSPPLQWSGLPPGTASLALLMDDPDAAGGTWIHWVLFNLPPDLPGLPAGLPPAPVLTVADNARHGRCWGVNSFTRIGYQGPEPPPGPAHRYRFTLVALDRPLGCEPGSDPHALLAAMAGHRLAQAQLTARYSSRPATGSRTRPRPT